MGIKMQLLKPDMEETQSAMKRYQSQGNREAVKMERAKLKNIKQQHGIFPLLAAVNIF